MKEDPPNAFAYVSCIYPYLTMLGSKAIFFKHTQAHIPLTFRAMEPSESWSCNLWKTLLCNPERTKLKKQMIFLSYYENSLTSQLPEDLKDPQVNSALL